MLALAGSLALAAGWALGASRLLGAILALGAAGLLWRVAQLAQDGLATAAAATSDAEARVAFRDRELNWLRQASTTLVADEALEPVLKVIVDATADLLGAEGATVGFVVEEGRFVRLAGGSGPLAASTDTLLPVDHSLLGWVVMNEDGLMVDDMAKDPRSYNIPGLEAKSVAAWVAERGGRIELFWLPRYSPELNAEEYLNNDLKGWLGAANLPRCREELLSRIERFMGALRNLPERVRSYFRHPCASYAAGY